MDKWELKQVSRAKETSRVTPLSGSNGSLTTASLTNPGRFRHKPESKACKG
jgi:hypothetical protein